MVITTLVINPGATSITVEVDADAGNTIIKAVAWNTNTYKDDAEGIDLTALLSSIDENEDFSITATDLGVENITGFWAVEFTSSEATTAEEPKEGIAVNLLPYYECVIDKSLAVKVSDCKIVKSECGKVDTLLFANTLLDTVHDTLIFGLYNESIKILKILDCMCEICTSCPDLVDTLSQTGYSYKTVNNILILA